ncbi:MAG TPA: hypothetical protein VN969_41510 [Streptosporangiaceae bacterium]|nr:hypothetical protein [Streptosporangiaceae bacterium]
MTGRLEHFGVTGNTRKWAQVADRLLDQITVTGRSFEAWRLDGSASLRAGTLDEPRDAILADYPKYAAGAAL